MWIGFIGNDDEGLSTFLTLIRLPICLPWCCLLPPHLRQILSSKCYGRLLELWKRVDLSSYRAHHFSTSSKLGKVVWSTIKGAVPMD